MRTLRVVVAALLIAAQSQPGVVLIRRAKVSGGGGGGDITFTELTQGSCVAPDTNDFECNTASISPTANAQVFVTVGFSKPGGENTGDGDLMTLSGCSLTFTLIGRQHYGTRRSIYSFRGTAASPGSSCALTINMDPDVGSTTPEEFIWTVDQATNVDGTTPNDAAQTGSHNNTTSLAIPDTGTAGSGDCTYGAFGIESAAVSANLEAGFTVLTNLGGGTGVRTIIAGYDCTAAIDETPSATWTGNNSVGGIGFIINKAP